MSSWSAADRALMQFILSTRVLGKKTQFSDFFSTTYKRGSLFAGESMGSTVFVEHASTSAGSSQSLLVLK
jgi:hypothetical protein